MLTTSVIVAMFGRSEGDFFHTDGPVTRGAAISAPCQACDVEATAVIGAPDLPALPPAVVSLSKQFDPPVARPFAQVILHARGRAPPSV